MTARPAPEHARPTTFFESRDGDGEPCVFARGLPSSHGQDIPLLRRCDLPVFWRFELWPLVVERWTGTGLLADLQRAGNAMRVGEL